MFHLWRHIQRQHQHFRYQNSVSARIHCQDWFVLVRVVVAAPGARSNPIQCDSSQPNPTQLASGVQLS